MVRNEVHIARHFWRDGKVAEWRASHQFPPALLRWLKTNYSELVSGSRSEWIDWSEGSCHLIFTDEREVHGRMATGLTACWVKEKRIDRDKFIDELRQIKGLVDNDSLLCFTTGASIRTQQRLKIPCGIMLGAIILFIAIGGYFVLNHQFYRAGSPPERITLSDQNAETNERSAAINHMQQAVPQRHISEQQRPQSTSLICSEVPRKPKKCYQLYIRERCENKTTSNYDNWLGELRNRDPNKFSKDLYCPNSLKVDPDLVELKKLEPGKREFYRKFLNGEELE